MTDTQFDTPMIDISPPRETFRPTAFLMIPALVGTTIVIAVITVIGTYVPLLAPVSLYAVMAAAALMLFRIASLFILYISTQLIVYDSRLVLQTGLIARSRSEMPIENVMDATLHQSILARIFRFGHIAITTRGADRWQIRNIGDAPRAARLILALAERASSAADRATPRQIQEQ